jgi:hypothetical protein
VRRIAALLLYRRTVADEVSHRKTDVAAAMKATTSLSPGRLAQRL